MISAIVPVFNAEKTINSCLTSLLNQDFNGKYEIILVDDGSADNTLQIIKGFLKKYKKKIRLMRQAHKGPATARNLGIKYARGDIILFTDSDCIVEKNWITQMIAPLKKEEISGVQGAYKTKQKEIIAKFCQLEIEERYEKMKKSQYIDFIGTYSAAYRKKIFQKIGGFNEEYKIASGEDMDFSFKAAKAGYKLVFNPDAVVYHHHPSNLPWYMKQKFGRAYWRIFLYKKYPKKAVKDSYTPAGLKIGLLSSFLLIFNLIALIFSRIFLIPVLFFLAIFLISAMPLTAFVIKKDFWIGLLTPLLIFIRDLTFMLGLIKGIITIKQ
jgi:cellulose synthase/poly-beta-1,6-N-acetylglucosamine synthase-like glycosyltransferase